MSGFFPKFLHSFNFEMESAWVMWVILLCFVSVIAIVVERWYYILVRSNINAPRFMAEVRKLVINGDLKKAINLCKAAGEKALPMVTLAALVEAEKKEFVDYRAIQNAVDESCLEIIPRLTLRTHYLSMFSNLATLMGLLGTILGLMQAFQAAGAAGAESAAGLAAGISTAWTATWWGLIVAILAIFFHSVISSKTNKIIDDIDEHSVKLIHLLTGSK